jgi:hypothetical protein
MITFLKVIICTTCIHLLFLFQQLFETGKAGVYACFKCQPLVPEVTILDTSSEPSDPLDLEGTGPNADEVYLV